MLNHHRVMEVSEVRAIATLVTREQEVSPDEIAKAQDAVKTMFQDAADYGLTKAEVVRAILTPMFERKKGCDCPTCKFRRAELELREVGEDIESAHLCE